MGILRRSAMNLIGRSYHRLSEAFIYSRMNVYRQISYIIINFIYRKRTMPVSRIDIQFWQFIDIYNFHSHTSFHGYKP